MDIVHAVAEVAAEFSGVLGSAHTWRSLNERAVLIAFSRGARWGITEDMLGFADWRGALRHDLRKLARGEVLRRDGPFIYRLCLRSTHCFKRESRGSSSGHLS